MTTKPCQYLDVTTAKNLQDAGQAILVDVREPAEHASESIPGSTLQPLSTLGTPPDANGKKIVVYCQGGSRSVQACRKWGALGLDQLYFLDGGFNAWKQAGLPVRSARGKAGMDVQRQLQLVIGLGTLTGLLLGLLVSPWFLGIAFVFAGGLTLAAITGLCPMAILIARMPWNQRTPTATTPGQSNQPVSGCSSKACGVPSSTH